MPLAWIRLEASAPSSEATSPGPPPMNKTTSSPSSSLSVSIAEASLPLAGRERLLRGLGDGAGALPPPQRDALLSGLGLACDNSEVTDLFLIGLATLNLLSEAASDDRLVVLVDDAQWLDSASAD